MISFIPFTLQTSPFHNAYYFLWHLVQPILGGVIGADIDFRNWTISRFELYLGCVLIGIFVSHHFDQEVIEF